MLDVTDREQIEAAATRVTDGSPGGLAGLVNNAGVGVGGPLELIPIEDFRHQIEVNLIGQVAVTQAFLPALRKARGRVVFLSSVGGLNANPYIVALPRVEVRHRGGRRRASPASCGVRRDVSLVEPGSVATPIWDKGKDSADAIKDRLTRRTIGSTARRWPRMGTVLEKIGARGVPPEKVAEAIGHALTATRPKTRYLVGADARMTLLMRRLLPDRLRDRIWPARRGSSSDRRPDPGRGPLARASGRRQGCAQVGLTSAFTRKQKPRGGHTRGLRHRYSKQKRRRAG